MTELLVSIAIIAVIAVMIIGSRDTSATKDESPAPASSTTNTPSVTTTPNYQLWASAALGERAVSVAPTESFISKWRATLSSSR